jgi:hypothetical protein
MEEDTLIKHFAIELGNDYETVENFYGEYIEAIEDEDDIPQFAETLTDVLAADYGGDLNEEDRAKFHYDLMFNSMTIAWGKMMEEEG